MTRWIRAAAIAAAFGFAVPAIASDAHDTATEMGAKTRKTARDLKPGDKTAEDRVDDAKDTAKEKRAQARKKARHAKHHAKKKLHEETR